MKYQLSRFIIGPGLHLLARTQVVGTENVPAAGGAILASNHLSVLDSFYLPLMLDRPVTFAAKSEYFTGKRPTDRIVGAYLRATKQLSVDRAGARAAQEMLEAAVAMIGTERILPPGHRVPRPGRIQIRVGRPLLFEEYAGQPAGARQRREVTDQVMAAIRELSGQDFVPMYASARKEQLAVGRAGRGEPRDRDPA